MPLFIFFLEPGEEGGSRRARGGGGVVGEGCLVGEGLLARSPVVGVVEGGSGPYCLGLLGVGWFHSHRTLRRE